MSEHDEQCVVFEWVKLYGIRMFSIPNGGHRNKMVAIKLKKEGLAPGIPDMFLPEAHHGYHGLFIELKYGKNKATFEQKYWIDYLNLQGYKAVVCVGADEAIKIIEEYRRE